MTNTKPRWPLVIPGSVSASRWCEAMQLPLVRLDLDVDHEGTTAFSSAPLRHYSAASGADGRSLAVTVPPRSTGCEASDTADRAETDPQRAASASSRVGWIEKTPSSPVMVNSLS